MTMLTAPLFAQQNPSFVNNIGMGVDESDLVEATALNAHLGGHE